MPLQTRFAETEYVKLTKRLKRAHLTVVARVVQMVKATQEMALMATGARRHTSSSLKLYFSVIS